MDFRLSTYVARQSWATILKKQGISTSLISEGLGHTNEKTTQIYLDSFEHSVLDKMNESLLK
jgi:site-specific recombinase XerD